MASYSVTTAKHATLAANTVDTVTLSNTVYTLATAVLVEVSNWHSSALIYFSTDGSTPTVAGNDTYVIGPGGSLTVAGYVVNLISASAAPYSVVKAG
jgi:hypothetical protein